MKLSRWSSVSTIIISGVTTILLSSCAELHHIQIGEIDSSPEYVGKPFEIKFSETGVNIGELREVSKVLIDKDKYREADNLAAFIQYFQMGPRTGNAVYVKGYAKNLIQILYEKCPSGNISGLASIRETRKYPVISGEIVKVTGFCMLKKGV